MRNHLFVTDTTYTSLNQAAPEVSLPGSSRPESSNGIPTGPMSLLPLVFVLAWAIAVLWSSRGKSSRPGLQQFPRYHKIPCKSCQFFKDNPYLKCAVNPAIASTKSAIECSDYTPQLKHVSIKNKE